MRQTPSPRSADRPPRPGFVLVVTLVVVATVATAWWRFGLMPTPAAARGSDAWAVSRVEIPTATPREARAAAARFASVGLPVYCGGGNHRVVALTFDDGPGPLTEATLEVLQAAGARATFFLSGTKLEDRFAHLPARQARMGALGNHTWNHRSLAGIPSHELAAEIDDTSAAITEAAGVPVRLFRPPFGERDAAVDAAVRARGLLTVLWSIDSGDSLPGATGPDQLRTLRREIGPGAIVLLHENRGTTHHMLPNLLRILERRNLRPVTVPELLAIDPPSMGQLRSGTCPGR